MSNDSKQVMKCQRRKKIEIVERFGGKCQICGYNKCVNALEFHHLGNKKESPSYIIMRWSWERTKEELQKCIMVCANCHREIHYKTIDIDPTELSQRKWRVHNCRFCSKDYETQNNKQIYCSQVCAKRYQSRPNHPDKEELRHLIRTYPQRQVAFMLDISQSTVRKWCQKYEIDLSEACRSFSNPERLAAKEAKKNRPKGIQFKRKFSLDQMRAAILDLKNGENSVRAIAKKHGMHHKLLIDVQRGRTYKELKSEFPDFIQESIGRHRKYPKSTLRSSGQPMIGSHDGPQAIIQEIATRSIWR